MTIRVSILITGTVQGVGFRPTVYKYALENEIVGSVSNTSQGVVIVAQGSKQNIAIFCKKIEQQPPVQSKITRFESHQLPTLGDETKFSIIESDHWGEKNVHISADLACCHECRQDIFDPNNRRYAYPFTNCTNCGPRFSIIKDRPYDRKLTSMDSFIMCPLCQEEYDNPLSRRFHAQPNACPQCGPALHLLGLENSEDTFEQTILQIKKGQLAAIKGLGGFNISCDPFNHNSILRLRQAKRRPNKSFAVMMKDKKTIQKFCHLSAPEVQWLEHASAPIVLLQKKSSELDHLSPDNNYLGVMLPYTPLHHLMMDHFQALVMTSANLADEPIAIDDHSIKALIEQGVVDFALSNNRKIVHRADDSILQVIDDRVQMIRRSRGFTPAVIEIDRKVAQPLLALGANMKNSFALARGNEVYLSQHIGELIDHRNYEYQKEQINDLKQLLEVFPESIYGDAHPGYENYSQIETKIYHHHAHLLSVIGEHNLFDRQVLGVIADGTGFGDDGTIWGFEFLKTNGDGFDRIANLKTFALPGGEAALKDLNRIAIALGASFKKDPKIQMLIDKNLNSPQTSSLGRLFDGVAALLNVCLDAEYEARGAIILQKFAEKTCSHDDPPYDVIIEDGILDYRPLIKSIEKDIKRNQTTEIIAYKFHQWVVDSIVKIIVMSDVKTVAFSGGCFQNRLLVELLNKEIKKLSGFQFYYNQMIPTNDGGIALGQAIRSATCV